MSDRRVLVTFTPPRGTREAIAGALEKVAEVAYLSDVDPAERAREIGSADAVFGWFLSRDAVPFDLIPEGVPVARPCRSTAHPPHARPDRCTGALAHEA